MNDELFQDASQTKTIPIRWLMLEAQRIRRDRIRRRIEAGAAIVAVAVWSVYLLMRVWALIAR